MITCYIKSIDCSQKIATMCNSFSCDIVAHLGDISVNAKNHKWLMGLTWEIVTFTISSKDEDVIMEFTKRLDGIVNNHIIHESAISYLKRTCNKINT